MVDFSRNKMTSLRLALLLLLVVFGVLTFVYNPYREEFNSISQRVEEYTPIEKERFHSGIITEIWIHRGFPMLTLNGGEKIGLPLSRNHEYEPYGVNDFLLIGDSIVKKSNNDTLAVFRADASYFFVLGQVINKE